MKKLLLTIAALASLNAGSYAQLANGSIAPDWTLTDLNGVSHHLYDLLDQGKTVFIDVSAAWCGPCWSYHTSGALEDLYTQHGPTGTVSQEVEVFFIEGEAQNTTDQLHGIAGSGSAQTTQGDWVTGTPYPIIDPSSSATTQFDNDYNIGYFPTIYMICRDHLVYEVNQLSTAELYARVGWCPTTPPATGADAKAVKYFGTGYFLCNANPTVKFQNYSTTNTITAATINVYTGATLVTSYAWTGSVAPLAVQSVTIPNFPGTVFSPYKFEVVVNGDTYTANDMSPDDAFKIYAAGNAANVPYSQGFESTTPGTWPDRIVASDDGYIFPALGGSAIPSLVTSDGTNGHAVPIDFYELQAGSSTELLIGNFNTQNSATVGLSFDVSYAQYEGTENDKLEVLLSKDCGATWNSVWSKSGVALSTHAPVGNLTQFIPTSTGDWRHETADMTAYKDANMFVKIKGTSDFGNFAWIDNLNMDVVTSVNEVLAENTINIYPNPAKDMAYVSFDVTNTTNVSIQVIDATGRIVSTVANEKMESGSHKIAISTATMASGIYSVKIMTDAGNRIERLSVVK